jgi:TRAP-type mannitol/chloroaromatic compound transport system permease large subunit
MTHPALGIIMLCMIVVAIMVGFPTAFTLMGLGFTFAFLFYLNPGQPWLDNQAFYLMVERAFSALNNDTLVSIPLFVLMGYVVERAAMVDDMFRSVQFALRRVPASLAVTTLIICTFWGIASGIVGAVVVLMGVIALGPMLRAGYDVRLATGVITAGGTLGILIPPSVMLIVYGAVAGQSVVKLYAAAMFPGFFLSLLYLAYIVGWALLDPKVAPRTDPSAFRVVPPEWMQRVEKLYGPRMLPALVHAAFAPRRLRAGGAVPVAHLGVLGNLAAVLFPLAFTLLVFATAWWYFAGRDLPESGAVLPEAFFLWYAGLAATALLAVGAYYRILDGEQLEILKMLLRSVIPLALLTAIVLGSILFGVATPTESAAVGVAGALLLALASRKLSFQALRESVLLTARTTAMVCWLFIGSAIFASAFALHGGQALIEKWVLGLQLSPLQFLLLSQAVIFLLGWPLEWTEIIVIFVPIFLPMLKHFQIDPILFGTLVAVNLQAAFLSPPVAMSAFYLKGVSPPHVTVNQIFAGMMPYMLIVILCMVVMYLFPGMTLWFPEFLYGR